MKIPFDRYSWQARILPVYLTITPAIFVLAALLPDALKLPLGSAAAVVSAALAFFFAQLGADFGKRLEKRLWRDWNGAPTTRFLRHSNLEFNEVTRGRVHEKLRALGLKVPTKEEQEANQQQADLYYESCVQELTRRTRDTKRFPLVFKGLVDYGFLRNLLGLKPIAELIALVSVTACIWWVQKEWSATGDLPAVPTAIALFSLALLMSWVAWVREGAVRLTAERYARFLLEAALDLPTTGQLDPPANSSQS